MFDTLRLRLVVGHILPLLLIVPLAGFALVYVSETRSLLPNLQTDVREQAFLAAELASEHPEIWTSPATAQAFVKRVDPYVNPQMMLLDPQGHILASTNPNDATRIGQVLSHAELSRALAGEIITEIDTTRGPQSEAVSAMVPVMTDQKRVLGVVRLTHLYETIVERLSVFRWISIGVLGIALLFGLALGLILAFTLERPVVQVTRAIYELVNGENLGSLAERGPREIRRLVRAFNILVERLAVLDESRRKLLGNLVHELGTPLGALNSGLQALQGGADEDPAVRRELLMGMQTEIAELRRLTDDLTQLSSQIAGGLAVHFRTLDLEAWLPRVLAPWREAAQTKGLHWNAPSHEGNVMLYTDPDRLAQILNNLISNAVKYTPVGGSVTIGVKDDDAGVRILVSDTGPGIPREEQARIFEPFFRSRSAKRFAEGMGLGLTIARELAQALGGQLTVESRVGQGTTFSIWLPLAPPAPLKR